MIFTLISSESRYPICRPKIKEKVKEICQKMGLEEVEVSVAIVGNRKIRELNRKYRQLDQPTEVLAFPLEEPRDEMGILRLGDIVISYPQALDLAREESKFVDEIILELVEHGLKHLLGFANDNRSNFKISSSKN